MSANLSEVLKAIDAVLDSGIWDSVADQARKPEENGDEPGKALAARKRLRELRKNFKEA